MARVIKSAAPRVWQQINCPFPEGRADLRPANLPCIEKMTLYSYTPFTRRNPTEEEDAAIRSNTFAVAVMLLPLSQRTIVKWIMHFAESDWRVRPAEAPFRAAGLTMCQVLFTEVRKVQLLFP